MPKTNGETAPYKISKIGIIVTSVLFAASAVAVLVALVCMATDAHVWHKLMPRALAAAAVTGLAFVVSIVLYMYDVKKAKAQTAVTEEPVSTEKEPLPPENKRSAIIGKAFKIAALVGLIGSVALSVAARFCGGLTSLVLAVISALFAFGSGVSAIVAVVLGRRDRAEKATLIGLISIPLLLLIMLAVFMILFGAVLIYIMAVSWAQWGLL